MNTETLSKEQFNSVKELAETSVKISEAKTILLNLENTKDEYISKREQETIEKIQGIFDKSTESIKNIRQNNEEIHTLYTVVSTYKQFLSEAYTDFKEMLTEFNEKSDLWDKKVENQYKEFSKIEESIKKDTEDIENTKKDIKKEKEQIDPNILIDVGVSLISDKPATTLVGRILRWIKKINTLRNGLNVKIK